MRGIYAYYKAHGIPTVVMGASFRSTAEIEALAGCDRLTIAPQLLDQLSKDDGVLTRKLSPEDVKGASPATALDEKTFRWMMNEDAMATEKLAEGILHLREGSRKLAQSCHRAARRRGLNGGDFVPAVDFWYEFASTYSYPAAMRIETLAGARRVVLNWRPFLLGPIFAARGMMDSPFNLDPAKGRYMWSAT